MSDTKIYNTSKSWQIMTYGLLPSISNLFLILMMFSNYLATQTYGIPVIAAGIIITGSRVFDAFSDPIVGMLVNKVNTRFGKARPLIVAGFLIMAASVLSMLFLGDGQGLFFFVLTYMGYILGTTVFQMGTSVGDVIMTNDPKIRPKIGRWSSVYLTFISTFVSFYLSKFLFVKHGGLNLGAFRELGLTVTIIGGIICLLGLTALREKDKPEFFSDDYSVQSQKVNIKDAWHLLTKNKAIVLMIIARSTDKLSLQTASNSAITMMVFGIIIGNYSFNGDLRLWNLIPTLVVLFMATKLAGNRGTRKSYIVWTWLSLAFSAALFVFMLVIDPKIISVSFVPTAIFVVLNALLAGAKMANNALVSVITPDLVDYEYYRSGKFMPAPVAAICSSVDKFISSFATTLVSFALAIIGYRETMPQATDTVDSKFFWMAMFLWLGMPVLGWIASLVAMKWYPLTKEKMVEIQEANYIKKQEHKATAEAH